MAIEVKSETWTGDLGAEAGKEPAAASQSLPRICGEFHDPKQLDDALHDLEGSVFQRADLSLLYPGRDGGRGGAAPDEGAAREDDARNLRSLGVGTAAAATGMAAAGAVIATGGAALPAAAAAAVAGGATAAAGEAVGEAAAPGGQDEKHQAAEITGVVLMVHAETPEKRTRAEQIMRQRGASRIWMRDAA